jgi:hypothetical protein
MTPEQRERCRQRRNERYNERKETDPDFVERRRAYSREWHRAELERAKSDPVVAERIRARAVRAREKLKADPERRERWLKWRRDWRATVASDPVRGPQYLQQWRAQGERYRMKIRSDPEAWARRLEDQRIARRLQALDEGRKPKARRDAVNAYKSPGSGGRDTVPSGPFVDWMRRRFPDWPTGEIAEALGLPPRRVFALLVEGAQRVRIDVVDRAAVSLYDPDLLNRLYPLDDDEAVA